jgi:pyruvate dehydrogenase E1 component alpha subunit
VSTQVKTPATGEVDRATRMRLYQLMVELRDFEQRAYELFLENLVRGTSHLALGQEAIGAGYAVAMRPDDYTFCTYRGHNHTLARGASMAAALAELMGRGPPGRRRCASRARLRCASLAMAPRTSALSTRR